MPNPAAVTDKQHRLTRLAMLALAAIAGVIALWPAEKTGLTGLAAEQKAQMDLMVQVAPYARMEGFEAPNEIEVSSAHIAAGYVDVPASTRMKVSFNTRQGFALQVNYDTAWISRVDIWADGQPLRVDEPNTKVIVARNIGRDVPVELRYRLHLAPGVRAGQYAWPISLAVNPVT
jgi:hypothetical protein